MKFGTQTQPWVKQQKPFNSNLLEILLGELMIELEDLCTYTFGNKVLLHHHRSCSIRHVKLAMNTACMLDATQSVTAAVSKGWQFQVGTNDV